MLYQAKNGTLSLGERTMDYLSFGSGDRALVMLPGLGDGLRTVKGAALPFALLYRVYAKQYKVYVLSRANSLAKGCTTRDMARDVRLAMDALSISSASVVGISQGGMIAQYLALDAPDRVEKLVLAVTLARANPTMGEVISAWIAMAEEGDYKRLMIDTAEKSYSEAYLRTHRWLFPLLGLVGKPKDFARFMIQAKSCLGHDAYGRLAELACPTLILGGGADRIVGPEAAGELAGLIRGSRLHIYDGLGHAAYEEAKDFHRRVLAFLQ